MRTSTSLEADLAATIASIRLLDHPFYRRWAEGGVGVAELRDYAAQYRHFEAALPGHLALVAGTAHGALRDQALRNLADEATHLELFDRFISGLGGERNAAPSPAMTALLDTYRSARDSGAAAGMAAVLAYEVQAPGVAASKAAGLREHRLLDDDDALAFWDVHARLDNDHAAWACDALRTANRAEVIGAAGAAAQAWWAFLDEREALHAAAAA